MKNLKLMVILCVITLLLVTACAAKVEEIPTAENEGDSEENQTPNDETPADTDQDVMTGSDITGITWLWERFDDTAGLNNIVVDDPSLYTLMLNVDGTYQLKADCNLVGGGYTLEGSNLKLESGPTTLAECGEDSLYSSFLTNLSNVVTFVTDGNKLVLNLWADGGNMDLVPAAQESPASYDITAKKNNFFSSLLFLSAYHNGGKGQFFCVEF